MIISIDGYDGTGKSSLAKKIMENDGFKCIYKPKIYMLKDEYDLSYEEASKVLAEEEKKLFSKPLNKKAIIKYYCDALLWLKKYYENYDLILDRGLLTTYAVVGNPDVAEYFDYYVNNGAFYDGSIYLTADDEERVKRIYNNDPNDPDLKYPVKWRDNDLEEYAASRNLNFYKIDTNNKSKDNIYKEGINFINSMNPNKDLEEVKKLRLIKNKNFVL